MIFDSKKIEIFRSDGSLILNFFKCLASTGITKLKYPPTLIYTLHLHHYLGKGKVLSKKQTPC